MENKMKTLNKDEKMSEYTVVINMKKTRKDLIRVKPAGTSFIWGDGSEVKRYWLIEIVDTLGDDYFDRHTLWGLGNSVNTWPGDIHEFPDNDSAKLWFRLNY
jgi:hypothetical protein